MTQREENEVVTSLLKAIFAIVTGGMLCFFNEEAMKLKKVFIDKSYEKRRNKPRLPIVYTTPDIVVKLDYLAGIHGSKKAAIEAAICELFNKGKAE